MERAETREKAGYYGTSCGFGHELTLAVISRFSSRFDPAVSRVSALPFNLSVPTFNCDQSFEANKSVLH
jgi:hypothetical protein